MINNIKNLWDSDPSDPLINTVVIIVESDFPSVVFERPKLGKIITHTSKTFDDDGSARDWRYIVHTFDYKQYLCYPKQLISADRLKNRLLVGLLWR